MLYLPDVMLCPTTIFSSAKREMKVLFPEPVNPNSSTASKSSLHVKSALRLFTEYQKTYSSVAEAGGLAIAWDITAGGMAAKKVGKQLSDNVILWLKFGVPFNKITTDCLHTSFPTI